MSDYDKDYVSRDMEHLLVGDGLTIHEEVLEEHWLIHEEYKKCYHTWRQIHKKVKYGIPIEPLWQVSGDNPDAFENFLSWSMGNGYAPHRKLRRIIKSIGYYPENLVWVTAKEANQMNKLLWVDQYERGLAAYRIPRELERAALMLVVTGVPIRAIVQKLQLKTKTYRIEHIRPRKTE